MTVTMLGCVRCYLAGITREATTVNGHQSVCADHAPRPPRVRHLHLVRGGQS